MDNTEDWFLNILIAYQEKDALIYDGKTYSYLNLIEQAEQYYTELNDFICKGQVVVILSDYSYYSIALLLALKRLKCIIVPVVSNIDTEVTDRIEESYCEWVINISSRGSLDFVAQPNKSEHPTIEQIKSSGCSGLILFSSGSTGKPKAMIHNLDSLFDSYRNRKAKHLTMLVFLMFDHIGGLNTLLNSLAMGARIVIPGSRSVDEIGRLIQKFKVNVLPSSPTFLNLMLIGKIPETYDVSSIKMITYGTEAMPLSLLERLKRNFPKVKFLQTFGTSETGIIQTTSRSSTSLDISLNDKDQKYKIVEGELWIKSRTQILGYLNAAMDSFTDDGWFKTGDLVEQTGEGYIKIIGRSKEVINVGGEKVLPAEVESVLLEMEEIVDCMVYAKNNAFTGQTVAVDVVLMEGFDKSKIKKEIRTYCKQKLDGYKIPSKIEIKSNTNYSGRFKKMRRDQ